MRLPKKISTFVKDSYKKLLVDNTFLLVFLEIQAFI